jgi:endonuclease/exonuclease/phosphatase (EEP) superfamily protein YafD
VTQDDWAAGERLLREWLRRAREGQHSHHDAGKSFRRANYWLAVPIIIIMTSLGTAAFATISSQLTEVGRLWFGALSILAAVLAALQTHFRYAEKAEKHKNLGAQYGAIRRHIEAVLSLPYPERGKQADVLDEIRYKLDAISADGDEVSRRIFERTQERLAYKDRAAAALESLHAE